MHIEWIYPIFGHSACRQWIIVMATSYGKRRMKICDKGG